MYELGDLKRKTICGGALQAQLDALRQKQSTPTPIQKQHELLRASFHHWELMTVDERRRLVSLTVPEIHAGAEGNSTTPPARRLEALPCARRSPRTRTRARNSSERKTGLERAVRTILRTLQVRDGGLDLLRRAA